VPTTYTQAFEQASIAADAATTITGEIAAAAVDIGAAQAEAAIDAGKVARTQAAKESATEPAGAQLAAAEAAIATAIADEVPPVEHTPVAKALNEVAPKPASAEHPLASTVSLTPEGPVELPDIRPPESVARPKQTRGPRRN
jgi:hypothetical protein